MKELLIVTSGGLPLPASKGGAVETLTELLLDENEISQHFHFTVLSIYDFSSKKDVFRAKEYGVHIFSMPRLPKNNFSSYH